MFDSRSLFTRAGKHAVQRENRSRSQRSHRPSPGRFDWNTTTSPDSLTAGCRSSFALFAIVTSRSTVSETVVE